MNEMYCEANERLADAIEKNARLSLLSSVKMIIDTCLDATITA